MTVNSTHFKFSPLYSFSRNFVNCSLPAGSFSNSRKLKLHRFTRRSGTSFLHNLQIHKKSN